MQILINVRIFRNNMDANLKEQKLREFAKSVLEYPEYTEEIEYLLSKLKLSKEEVIRAYVNYDLDIFAYENEIYESLAMRMVLYLHYLLKGSWHQDRQDSILRMIEKIKPESIIDMGFGAPTKYIRYYVLKNKVKTTLADLYGSAFEFSKVLFDYLNPSWNEFILFKQIDMNKHEYPGDFDCYIFQDSIDHVNDSTKYLNKLVKESPSDSRFIFSLPIGPMMSVHTINWDTEEEAIKWLEDSGLKILDSDKVFINPDVDLFAEQIKEELYNLIVICKKQY